MVSDAHALDWRETIGRNRAVVSWMYHTIEHGWVTSAVKFIQGSCGIPTALNGQYAWRSQENWSLVEGICMAVIMRAQYFKQSSLSLVWRLYLPVSYVTMPKLHGVACSHDEVVWFWHCVDYPDGWLMSVWEFVHVLYHHSCGIWSSVQKFVSGRSGDVRLYCCVTCGWVWGQSIMLLCHRWCVIQFTALLHGSKSLPPVPSRSEIFICCCA